MNLAERLCERGPDTIRFNETVPQDQIGRLTMNIGDAVSSMSSSNLSAVTVSAWNRVIKKYVDCITEWHLSNLSIQNQGGENIPKSIIQTIKFPYLAQLNIRSANLASLEFFLHSSLPSLTKLFLVDNVLSDIRPLTKMQSPKLSDLEINKNHIQSLQCLSFAHFPNLCVLNVEEKFDEPIQGQDISDLLCRL